MIKVERFLCAKVFNYKFNFCKWIFCCSSYFFLFQETLVVSAFQQMCTFHLGCQVCWPRARSISSLAFDACGICSHVTSLISTMVIYVFSIFSYDHWARDFKNLFIISKKQLAVSLIFSINFLFSISLVSALIFIYFCLSWI